MMENAKRNEYFLPENKVYLLYTRSIFYVKQKLDNDNRSCTSDDAALQLAIAAFKTPTLRDLGHSAPYMHNGQSSDLHAIMNFYITTSQSGRADLLRNIDPELKNVEIEPKDIQPLVQFLISLY